VVPLLLGAQPRLDDVHVEDECLVVAIDERRAVADGDALDLGVRTEDLAGDLGGAVGDPSSSNGNGIMNLIRMATSGLALPLV
jgi:hypothetical protein